MSNWFQRWEERQHEQAESADADLMLANRQRNRIANRLIVVAVVLALVAAKFQLPTMLRRFIAVGAGVSGIVGLLMAKWVQAEHEFLTRPDPEGPPEITPK